MATLVHESSYNTPKKSFSITEIRQKLLTFSGGSINCEKYEETGLATICINHPERRNAISGKMLVDFENIIEDLDKWYNGKAIILFGAEEMFCSGGDLNFIRQLDTPQLVYEMSMFTQNIYHRFSNLPLVSVAYISGFGAVGGGAEIATFCDYRLLNRNSKIGFVHNKMGIVPAWGGTTKLIQLVGHHKALDLILSSKLLSYTQAKEIGLVDDTVNNFNSAKDWILQKVSQDTNVIRATKYLLISCSPINNGILETHSKILSTVMGGQANKKALQMNLKHV